MEGDDLNIKLGSLFDGIGGFPYVGTLLGIEPIWASEIEPFPIRVTEHHFPNMKHLGDITQIDGAEIEPVDIITFGSPCQDLSVAGKREGLAGARSGLFMEAVRIIRQMRTATDGQYPRFAVWENVPGAFSSNKGEDFRAVLEEIAEAEIPMPRSGKWATAGMVRTATADIAWRTIDAQHWGVPQRRRRIFLVADFAGQCAGEILFVEESLRGDFAESRETRQETAATVGDCVAKSSCLRMREGCFGGGKGPLISEEKSLTLGRNNDQALIQASYWDGGQISDCLDCSMLAKGQMMPEKRWFPAVLYDMTHADEVMRPVEPGIAPTLNSRMGTGGNQVPVMLNFTQNQRDEVRDLEDKAVAVDCRNLCENKELSGTIQAKENGGQSLNYINPIRLGYAVRRLTPLECERLQGFPDNWTNVEWIEHYKYIGKNPKRKDIPMKVRKMRAVDTNRYKAIGNSVAIPCVLFVLGGIARVLKKDRAA